MNAVFVDVKSVKITYVSKKTAMFIFYFKDGASENSVNLYQIQST